MNSKTRRILTASVSTISLGIAGAGLAQPAEPQIVLEGVLLPDQFVFEAGETFTSGVTTTGTNAATSTVTSIPTGTIVQGEEGEEHTVDKATVALALVTPLVTDENGLLLENAGVVSVLSTATATNTEGHAVANAHLENAVSDRKSTRLNSSH